MYTPPGAKVFHKENRRKSIWPAALEPLSMMMSQGPLEIKESSLVNWVQSHGGLRNITISPKGGETIKKWRWVCLKI
jgi:hypothetical protein